MNRLPWWLTWLVLPAVVLVVAGWVVVQVLQALLGLAFYLIVGALAVGGAWMLYTKSRQRLTGRGSRSSLPH